LSLLDVKILSGWAKFQTAEEMEISRKYEYALDFVPFLCKWLCPRPRPSSVVVDVGCGSGYFTKIIAKCMKGEGKVVGIDPDRELIRETKKYARESRSQASASKLETSGKSHSKVTMPIWLLVM